MTRRLLEPSEWARLDATGLAEGWRFLHPDRSRVVVVEDDSGAIVGCWAFYLQLHAHGVWVAPAHQKRSAVARHLWRGLQDAAAAVEAETVWTGAAEPSVAAMLEHHGAVQPGTTYVLPMTREIAECQQ